MTSSGQRIGFQEFGGSEEDHAERARENEEAHAIFSGVTVIPQLVPQERITWLLGRLPEYEYEGWGTSDVIDLQITYFADSLKRDFFETRVLDFSDLSRASVDGTGVDQVIRNLNRIANALKANP